MQRVQITRDSGGQFSMTANPEEFITASFVVNAEATPEFIAEVQAAWDKFQELQEQLSEMWEENF